MSQQSSTSTYSVYQVLFPLPQAPGYEARLGHESSAGFYLRWLVLVYYNYDKSYMTTSYPFTTSANSARSACCCFYGIYALSGICYKPVCTSINNE